jgi:hypothetical protein
MEGGREMDGWRWREREQHLLSADLLQMPSGRGGGASACVSAVFQANHEYLLNHRWHPYMRPAKTATSACKDCRSRPLSVTGLVHSHIHLASLVGLRTAAQNYGSFTNICTCTQ